MRRPSIPSPVFSFALAAALLLAGCDSAQPLKIGFIGNLSGRFADLDTLGRDGAVLAVEQRNRQGGIGGRKVELLIRDTGEVADSAAAAVHDLAGRGAIATTGPMTSVVAVAAAPAAAQAKLVIVAGTATTTTLSGKDDYFFRVVPDAAIQAATLADHQRQTGGHKRAAVIVDNFNRDYVDSWSAAYQSAFEQQGGKVVKLVRFDSRTGRDYGRLAAELLAAGPDVVTIATDPTDAALIAQRLRQAAPEMALAGSNWTSIDRLIEIGGKSVEGMLVEQSYNRSDNSERFRDFRRDFTARFGRPPGIGAIAGFDAANVVMAALARGARRDTMKSTLLAIRSFDGLQGEIRFDDYGDARRRMYLARIEDGRFAALTVP